MAYGSEIKPVYAGIAIAAIGGACIAPLLLRSSKNDDEPSVLRSFFLFFYSCFIKPHQGDAKGTQQDALESFYKKQAGAYDATRKILLRGREDMLSLVAAQLEAKPSKASKSSKASSKRVWVDVSHLADMRLSSILLTDWPFVVDRRWYWLQHRSHVAIR